MDAGGDAAVTKLVSVNGLPILGALISILRNALAFFSHVLQGHGDRVALRFPGRRVILLCHPDEIEEVLVKDRSTFGRSAEIRKLRPIFHLHLVLESKSAFRYPKQSLSSDRLS